MDAHPQDPPSSQPTPAPAPSLSTASNDAEHIIAAIMTGGTTLAQLGTVLKDASELEATTRSGIASPSLTRGGENLVTIGHALSRVGSAPPPASSSPPPQASHAPSPIHLAAPSAVSRSANIVAKLGNLVRDAGELDAPSRSGAVSPTLARGGETLSVIGNAFAGPGPSSPSPASAHRHDIPPHGAASLVADPHVHEDRPSSDVTRGGELMFKLGALVKEAGEIDAPTGSGAVSPSLARGGDTLSKLGAALVGPPPASPNSPHSASAFTRGGETLARIGAVFGEEGNPHALAHGGETLAKFGGILTGVGNLHSEIRPMLSAHPTDRNHTSPLPSDRDAPAPSQRRVSVAPVVNRDLPPLPSSSRAPSTSRQHTLRRSYSPNDEYLAGAESLGREPTLTFARRPMSDSTQYAGIGSGGGGIGGRSPRPDAPPGLRDANGHASWNGAANGAWTNAPPSASRGVRPMSGASQDRGAGGSGHGGGGGGGYPNGQGNGADVSWIVPEEKRRREMTVGERLQPTIDAATAERDKAVARAKWTGLTLNVAIGLQVLFGALTTGLGAALHNASITISILGGASTLVASYLARARGSNEPEFSALRVQALEHFLREAHAFKLDRGHMVGHDFDAELEGYRRGLEGLLVNRGEGAGQVGASAGGGAGVGVGSPVVKQGGFGVGYGHGEAGLGMPGMPGGMHPAGPHLLPMNTGPGATMGGGGTGMGMHPHSMPVAMGGAMPVGVGTHPGMGGVQGEKAGTHMV